MKGLGIIWGIFVIIFGVFYIFVVIWQISIFVMDLVKKIKSYLKKLKICSYVKKGSDFIVEQNKMRKVLTIIMVVLMSLAIIGILYDAFMPSVMKYPHNLVQSFSSDVIENESNVLRRNINDTVENVNIDIKQSNENVEKKEDYIKKEYLDSATYSYNVVNTISGILTPLFSLLAVIAAFVTLYRQRKQNEIQNFENHLFQMIDQQHKLEEKVVNKHGSFRELYEKFFKICFYVFYDEDFNEVVKGNDKRNEIGLKIANYIFYFGADKDFLCDKTFQILTGKNYGLDKKKLKALISKLNKNKKYSERNGKKYYLFHTQKSEELGIYYRNLFNAIRYIDWECPDDDMGKKKEYAKLVRTNLSDFAQLMLYYNMQGERGKAWMNKDEVKDPKGNQDCLLTRYKPIKNCAISVIQLDDKQIQEILEIHSNESDQKIIPFMTEILLLFMMENKLDIDPRNDGRKELFSDDVIDYELKIGKQDN
ncbi:MAG: hypothetical protein IKK68_05715 [Paludibacteraceae bacterium]|nr:hypothetical protein [Paludibacteraceae bacterium]